MNDTATPVAERNGIYRCTGLGHTKFRQVGDLLEPCPVCQNGTAIWLYSPGDNGDSTLITVRVELDTTPRPLWLQVDRLFTAGDLVNLRADTEMGINDNAPGTYRITKDAEQGESLNFVAVQVARREYIGGQFVYQLLGAPPRPKLQNFECLGCGNKTTSNPNEQQVVCHECRPTEQNWVALAEGNIAVGNLMPITVITSDGHFRCLVDYLPAEEETIQFVNRSSGAMGVYAATDYSNIDGDVRVTFKRLGIPNFTQLFYELHPTS